MAFFTSPFQSSMKTMKGSFEKKNRKESNNRYHSTTHSNVCNINLSEHSYDHMVARRIFISHGMEKLFKIFYLELTECITSPSSLLVKRFHPITGFLPTLLIIVLFILYHMHIYSSCSNNSTTYHTAFCATEIHSDLRHLRHTTSSINRLGANLNFF